MSLWGKQNAVESRPKHLPNDSNAPHGREFCQARSCYGLECEICKVCNPKRKTPIKTKK